MELHKPPYRLKELKLEVTHDCHLRCVHCSSMSEVGTSRELSLEKCKEVLSEASEMGVVEVAFSGGEPLMWPHLTDAVHMATSCDMDVSLYTTGNAKGSEQIFDELKLAGIDHVMFSLFSEDRDAHEEITKVKGSFEITLAAVKKCIDLGLDVELHFVPLPYNFRSLRPISEMCKKLGVSRISVLRLVPQGRGASNETRVLNFDENKALRQLIVDLRKEGHEIRTGSPFNALMLRDKPQCCSGIDRLTVSPELRIFPCDAFKQVTCDMMGVEDSFTSLKDASLVECWENSPYLNKVREYLTTPFAEECAVCSALEKCLSGCVAQKFHAYGSMLKCADPMCLM